MKRIIQRLLTGAMLAGVMAAPAFADGSDDLTSPWQIRVRILGVLPDASGSSVSVAGAPIPASLSIGNSVVPEADVSYFFTPNWSVEAIAAVTPHDISGTGAISGLSVGKAWLLPPTVTGQYHLTAFGAFQPYVGAGVNYTIFYDQKAANNPSGGLAVTGLHLKDTFGVAVQGGFDYMMNAHWGLNFDVKKLFLEPDYTAVVNNAIPVTGKAHINPWLTGAGVTYRF